MDYSRKMWHSDIMSKVIPRIPSQVKVIYGQQSTLSSDQTPDGE